jgi:hypothetical protein
MRVRALAFDAIRRAHKRDLSNQESSDESIFSQNNNDPLGLVAILQRMTLLDRDRLGEVARLVDIATPLQGEMIREELQRDVEQ